MKVPFYIIAFSFIIAFALAQKASANFVKDATFTSVTFSGTPPAGSYTTLFGQFGSDSASGFATGSNLTVSNWDTSGYNFVYAPNTADFGTQANAYNTGSPHEVPGQYSAQHGGAGAFYGNTYLWGTNNGGAGTMTGGGTGTVDAVPGGGNFIALDGVYEVHPVSQTITGLTIGKTYVLTFYYAGAQQESFSGSTSETLTVNFNGTFVSGSGATSGSFTGGTTYTTPTISLPNHAFSGWYQGGMLFAASSTSATLNFLAGGTPTGEPPFTLLGGVDLEQAPDFSNWMVFAGFGAACILFEILRRRRSNRRLSANLTLAGSFPAAAKFPVSI